MAPVQQSWGAESTWHLSHVCISNRSVLWDTEAHLARVCGWQEMPARGDGWDRGTLPPLTKGPGVCFANAAGYLPQSHCKCQQPTATLSQPLAVSLQPPEHCTSDDSPATQPVQNRGQIFNGRKNNEWIPSIWIGRICRNITDLQYILKQVWALQLIMMQWYLHDELDMEINMLAICLICIRKWKM